MFEGLKATADTFEAPAEKKDTSTASPAETKPTAEKQNASEGAKTPESKDGEGLRFDKHSRFKELIDERDKYRSEAEDYKSKYETLTKSEQTTARQQASDATGVAKAEIPNFETVQELVQWVAQQTALAEKNAVSAYKAAQESETREVQEVDAMINSQLDELAQTDENLMNKDGRDELLQFALDNEITNLKIAHNLLKKINVTKEEGVKKGEEIAKRKEGSGPKTTPTGSTETKMTYRRGQSLNDAIAEAKRNLLK